MAKNRIRPRPPPQRILREFEEHSRWLASAGKEGVRLGTKDERIDFHGLDLRSADLSVALLNSQNFSFADLRGAWLIGTELDDSNFEGSDIRAARFDWAILSVANFIGTKGVTAASFKHADVKHTIWTKDDQKRQSARLHKRVADFLQQMKSWSNAERDLFRTSSAEAARAADRRNVLWVQRRLADWRRAHLLERVR